MVRYIHGSEDSTDIDIHYVVDKLPDKTVCKKFCSEDPNENRNMIVINNGKVTECYKGTVDEVNNALIDTYNNHIQEYPLLVTERVPRVKSVKYIRAVRGILSHLSRSQFRTEVKNALKSSWSVRIQTLLDIDLSCVDFSSLNNNMTAYDIAKVISFQIGQCRGLFNDIELYTKREVAETYPELKPYLYREQNIDLQRLSDILHDFIRALQGINTNDIDEHTVKFIDDNITIDLIHENIV